MVTWFHPYPQVGKNNTLMEFDPGIWWPVSSLFPPLESSCCCDFSENVIHTCAYLRSSCEYCSSVKTFESYNLQQLQFMVLHVYLGKTRSEENQRKAKACPIHLYEIWTMTHLIVIRHCYERWTMPRCKQPLTSVREIEYYTTCKMYISCQRSILLKKGSMEFLRIDSLLSLLACVMKWRA